MKKVFAFLFTASIIAVSLYAHSGRTDSSGCHNDTKSGTYHCH